MDVFNVLQSYYIYCTSWNTLNCILFALLLTTTVLITTSNSETPLLTVLSCNIQPTICTLYICTYSRTLQTTSTYVHTYRIRMTYHSLPSQYHATWCVYLLCTYCSCIVCTDVWAMYVYVRMCMCACAHVRHLQSKVPRCAWINWGKEWGRKGVSLVWDRSFTACKYELQFVPPNQVN